MNRAIHGAGGGGKGGGGSSRAPVESPDSLRSRQYARVVDVVSEGEISGLIDGLKSVYLDDTPVQNADGTFNFSGVTLVSRVGTQNQTYIPGFPAVESETAVATEVLYGLPVTRSIVNPNTNAVRVTVSTPRLTYQNPSTGDLGGTGVQFMISMQTAGGGFVPVALPDDGVFSGKTTSKYQRAYRIPLTGTGPWDIRVARANLDSTTATVEDSTYWDSYTEIIDAKLSYPNSALNALAVDAERFSSIPRRGYECKGLLVRIPSNYDPVTRVYTGVWNGSFSYAWTNNPAWCFYDLLVSGRYGLGDFIDISQVDKWTLYQIGRHCDELVDDGFGGLEPRFTCSLYLQSREEAFRVVSSFASVFCGNAYWASGAVTATQDAPSDPVALFTPANVIAGDAPFSYVGSSIKARHTVALVSWNDPNDRYRQRIEYVEDEEGIARYGVVQTEVVALGCTSRGQAHRFGRRILYTERLETETVSFTAGLDGLAIAPGEIIQISDPVRAGLRLGGRILAATTTSITLDDAVTFTPGLTYTLWTVLPNGAVEQRTVSAIGGTASVLTVQQPFSAAPVPMAIWVLSASNLAPESWRVISIREVEGTRAEITALKHSPDKYGQIEDGIILEPLQTGTLNDPVPTPTDLVVSEALYLVTPSVVGNRATISWAGSAVRYELTYRRNGENWTTLPSEFCSVDIDAPAGTYEFSLFAFNSMGRRSLPRNLTVELYGLIANPADLTGLAVIAIAGRAHATWILSADLDVRVGGRIVVRHSPLIAGANWENGIVLDDFNGDAVNGVLPLMTGTYMVKAKDSSQNYSQNISSFIATESQLTGFTTIATSTQNPDFLGAKTGLYSSSGTLSLSGVTPIDSLLTNVDTWGFIDSLGGVSPTGSYEFDTYMDFGAVTTVRLNGTIEALAFDSGDLIDDRGLVDGWGAADGGVINDTDAELFYSITQTDPAGSPTWGPFTSFMTADVTCRAARFRLDVASESPTHNLSISTLSVIARTSP
jgi:predicted phage tail protein